jgi:hypothetical protein
MFSSQLDKMAKNDRLSKALTGMSWKEIQTLESSFAWNLKEYTANEKKIREKRLGRKLQNDGGRPPFLKNDLEKLVFVLIYLKIYPTFDVLSFIIGFSKSNCHPWVIKLMKVLEQTLGRDLVLPERRVTSPEEFLKLFPEVEEIFIDATERRFQRPKDQKKQNKLYSKKKKTHTRKNVIISGKGRTKNKKEILVVTKTKSGRRHDKRLADKENLFDQLPENLDKYVDSGFQGVQEKTKNVQKPRKKPRKSKRDPDPSLTLEEKEMNRLIASIRVLSENAICGVKRFNCLVNTYRNKIVNLDDQFILLSAGLWNYHLKFS